MLNKPNNTVGRFAFDGDRRIKRPADFQLVYKNNQTRAKGQYFMVLAFLRAELAVVSTRDDKITETLTLARLGAVVSKKVSNLAVKRNRVKRLIRESFREENHPRGFDFVVIANPSSNSVPNRLLTKDLNVLWRRLHQRCEQL